MTILLQHTIRKTGVPDRGEGKASVLTRTAFVFPDGDQGLFRNGVRQRGGSDVAHSEEAVLVASGQVLRLGGVVGVGVFPR